MPRPDRIDRDARPHRGQIYKGHTRCSICLRLPSSRREPACDMLLPARRRLAIVPKCPVGQGLRHGTIYPPVREPRSDIHQTGALLVGSPPFASPQCPDRAEAIHWLFYLPVHDTGLSPFPQILSPVYNLPAATQNASRLRAPSGGRKAAPRRSVPKLLLSIGSLRSSGRVGTKTYGALPRVATLLPRRPCRVCSIAGPPVGCRARSPDAQAMVPLAAGRYENL